MAIMTAPERYGESVLSPDWHGERDRLLAMAEVADPTTVRVERGDRATIDIRVDPRTGEPDERLGSGDVGPCYGL